MSYYEKLCEKVSKEYSEFLEEMESVDSDAAKEREEEHIIKEDMVDEINGIMISEDLSKRLYSCTDTLQTLFTYWCDKVDDEPFFETSDFIYNCALSIIPFIKEEKQTAIDNGFVEDWEASFIKNKECALTLSDKLNYSTASCEDVIREMMLLYDNKERIEYVLAANCFDKCNDKRFDERVVRWGQKIFEKLPEFFKEKASCLQDNGNPVLMNKIINTYIGKELTKGREVSKKKDNSISLD